MNHMLSEDDEAIIRSGIYNVLKCDMPDELKELAIVRVHKALEKAKTEKEAATLIKTQFDSDEGHAASWHCIVGKHFAVSITYATKYLMFMQNQKNHTILLFRSEDTEKDSPQTK